MKKKVCKKCKLFVEGDECPIHGKDTAFTTTWQGRIWFLHTDKSMIAHHMGVEKNGEYAIKVR